MNHNKNISIPGEFANTVLKDINMPTKDFLVKYTEIIEVEKTIAIKATDEETAEQTAMSGFGEVLEKHEKLIDTKDWKTEERYDYD